MKDNELREMFASLERKIEAATATMVGGDPKELLKRINSMDTRLAEIQARTPSEGRQIFDAAYNRKGDELLRETLANLERKIDGLNAIVVATDWSKTFDRYLEDIKKRVEHIQELAEAGRRFGDRPIELPSPRIPMLVGMAFGVALFLAGIWLGYMIK